MTLIVLRSAGWVFCRMSLNWDLSAGFLMIRLGLWALGRKPTEVNCHFHSTCERNNTQDIIVGVNCGHLAEVCLSTGKLPPHPVYTVPFGGNDCGQFTLTDWGVMLHFLEGRVHKIFVILVHGRSVSSPFVNLFGHYF